jgi:serine/threonine-protein kinase
VWSEDSEEHPLHTEASGAAHPEAFGPFRVLHQIGAGALGPVFRAYHPEDDRLVAIKLFKLDLLPELVHKLVAELQTLIDADLTHPGIAAPLAAGISDVAAYLAQDFVASDSLDSLAREHGPAPPGEAIRIASEIAGALDFAADANVLHGALHPRDILVSPDDARLTGLGIARALDKLGVPVSIRRPYTAPEGQARERWDRRADIFSLAAIAHELLWGRRITALGDEAAAMLTPVGAADVDALRELFARALAPDPRDRFESAGDFIVELKHAIGRAPEVRGRSSGRRLVVDEDLRLPLEPDLVDEPLVPDEPEIVLERHTDSEDYAPAFLQAPDTELPEVNMMPGLKTRPTELEETVRHEETVPMVLPPVTPDRTVIHPEPPALESRPPVRAKAVLVEEVEVPPPAFAALNEPSRSSLWPLALSLAIGLAVGFAAGYASGGRASTQASAEARAADVPSVMQAPAALSGVPETEVRVPGAPASEPPKIETPKVEAPAPRPAQTRPAPTHAPSRLPASTSKSSAVAKNRAPSVPPEPARTSATSATGGSTSAMMVESKPSHASVRVDGRMVGQTPLKLPSVAAGDHSIVIEHEGYRRWASSVRIVAGKPSRVTASLER